MVWVKVKMRCGEVGNWRTCGFFGVLLGVKMRVSLILCQEKKRY